MAEPHVKKPGFFRSLSELVRSSQPSGSASPAAKAFFETSVVPLEDVMKLYERDPTCKSSVDLLSAFTVGMGFYTTCAEDQEKAKEIVDGFCEEVNLDRLLNDMARPLIACGNDFWLKLTPERLTSLVRIPVDAVGKIKLGSVEGFKIPFGVEAYELENKYKLDRGSGSLNPEAVIHWQLNSACPSGFGVGLLQVLIHTLTISSDKRPAYAWMKAKIEKIMPKIFEKYAGPDVLALKIFSQPTKYAHVLGYVKALQDRWGGFEKIRADFTREGPSIISDMETAGISNAEGVNFSVPRKSEMASLLKQRMMNQQFFYPLLNWEKPYRSDICTELNVERYELRKDGTIGFSHPNGTHDDVYWSLALAVYSTVAMGPEPFLAVVPRLRNPREVGKGVGKRRITGNTR